MSPFEESQERVCGSFSPASEGRKISGSAVPEGFKGIKERKANTEEKMCYLFLEQSYIGSFLLSSNTCFPERIIHVFASFHRI